jgi:hypothetical protein
MRKKNEACHPRKQVLTVRNVDQEDPWYLNNHTGSFSIKSVVRTASWEADSLKPPPDLVTSIISNLDDAGSIGRTPKDEGFARQGISKLGVAITTRGITSNLPTADIVEGRVTEVGPEFLEEINLNDSNRTGQTHQPLFDSGRMEVNFSNNFLLGSQVSVSLPCLDKPESRADSKRDAKEPKGRLPGDIQPGITSTGHAYPISTPLSSGSMGSQPVYDNPFSTPPLPSQSQNPFLTPHTASPDPFSHTTPFPPQPPQGSDTHAMPSTVSTNDEQLKSAIQLIESKLQLKPQRNSHFGSFHSLAPSQPQSKPTQQAQRSLHSLDIPSPWDSNKGQNTYEAYPTAPTTNTTNPFVSSPLTPGAPGRRSFRNNTVSVPRSTFATSRNTTPPPPPSN